MLAMGMSDAQDSCTMNKLMQLRKVVNHPFLFGEPRTEGDQFIGEVRLALLVLKSRPIFHFH